MSNDGMVGLVCNLGTLLSALQKHYPTTLQDCLLFAEEPDLRYLQTRYIAPDKFYGIANLDNTIDNPDQRITQDVDRFTESARQILETAAIVPGLIVYYSYQVAEINNGSFLGPGLIYLYFIASCLVLKVSITPLIPLIYNRERAEGLNLLTQATFDFCMCE